MAFPPSRLCNRSKNSGSLGAGERLHLSLGWGGEAVVGVGGVRGSGPPVLERFSCLPALQVGNSIPAPESARASRGWGRSIPARARVKIPVTACGSRGRWSEPGRLGGAEKGSWRPWDLCPLSLLRGPPGESDRVGKACQEFGPGVARVRSLQSACWCLGSQEVKH